MNESIVITGASSGIGRAAALAFAKQKAYLTLISRSHRVLEEVAAECERLGAQTLVCPVDVASESKLKQCAAKTLETFGKIDVWVNDAAVLMFGRLEETPEDTIRRVIETNLMGYINGCRAALPNMRSRNKGVIINISAVEGVMGQPYGSIYAATKSAVNILGSSLRMELMGTRVKVCTLILPSVDTPMFQHEANYTGRAVRAMPPVYSPMRVARVITRLARRPRPAVVLGLPANVLMAMKRALPYVWEPLFARMVYRSHFRKAAAPRTSGNLFMPMEKEDRISGGWLGRPSVKKALQTV